MSEYGSGSGTTRLYVVEARWTGYETHHVVNGVTLTHEWQRVRTVTLPPGALVEATRATIPDSDWPPHAKEHGLLDRAAAYAMAIRFQVESGDEPYSAGHAVLCVETRLVEVELSYSFDIKEIGVCAPVSLVELLRNLPSTPRPPAAEAEA